MQVHIFFNRNFCSGANLRYAQRLTCKIWFRQNLQGPRPKGESPSHLTAGYILRHVDGVMDLKWLEFLARERERERDKPDEGTQARLRGPLLALRHFADALHERRPRGAGAGIPLLWRSIGLRVPAPHGVCPLHLLPGAALRPPPERRLLLWHGHGVWILHRHHELRDRALRELLLSSCNHSWRISSTYTSRDQKKEMTTSELGLVKRRKRSRFFKTSWWLERNFKTSGRSTFFDSSRP